MTVSLSPYEQTQLARLQQGCVPNTSLNPIARNAFHKLRETGLVAFRAGQDDFEWFALPQETETQEAPAAAVSFVPKKGMQVEFQKAFPTAADKGKWFAGMYWGVYAGNPKLHMVRFGGISEPAWDVRSLAGESASEPAASEVAIVPLPKPTLEGEIVRDTPPLKERVMGIRDSALREVAAALFDIALPTPAPVYVPANGAIEDAVYTPVSPVVSDEAEGTPEPAGEPTEGAVQEGIVEEPVAPAALIVAEPAPDIFNGMADFEPQTPQVTVKPVVVRKTVSMTKLNITPAMFKQARRGIVTTAFRVNTGRLGKAWTIGRWDGRTSLVLLWNGTLLLLDGPLAYEVRPRHVDTLDALFTAWAGVNWRKDVAAV